MKQDTLIRNSYCPYPHLKQKRGEISINKSNFVQSAFWVVWTNLIFRTGLHIIAGCDNFLLMAESG